MGYVIIIAALSERLVEGEQQMADSTKPDNIISDGGHYIGCPYCFGAGSLIGVTCEQCNGTTKIWMWDYGHEKDLDSIKCPSCHTVGRIGPSAVGGTFYCYECSATFD